MDIKYFYKQYILKAIIEKKIKNSSDEGVYQKKLSALYKNYEQKLQGTELIKFY